MSQYIHCRTHDEYFPKPGTAAWIREGLGLYSCTVCLRDDIDPIDYPAHEVKGKKVCRECVRTCDLCGEWLDDTNKVHGPSVQHREWANDGRLSEPMHAICAANGLLGDWAGETDFDSEIRERDEIEAIVFEQFRRAA